MPTRWESGDVAVTSPSPKRKGKPSKPTYYAPSGPSSYKRAVPAPTSVAAPASSPATEKKKLIRAAAKKVKRAETNRQLKKAKILKKLIENDEDSLDVLDRDEKKLWESLDDPKKLEARAEKKLEDWWKEAKSVSGLKGPMPKVTFDSKDAQKRNVPAYVIRDRIKFVSPAEAFADRRPSVIPGKGRKDVRGLALHEFAHIGQVRGGDEEYKPEDDEGRADRYANILARKLNKRRSTFAQSDQYAPYRKRARSFDTQKDILYGQFGSAKRARAADGEVRKGPKLEGAKSSKPAQRDKRIVRQAAETSGSKFLTKQAVKAGRKEGVKPSVLMGVMDVESDFGRLPNTFSGSSAGARGVTQFMPGTAPSYGVDVSPTRKAIKTQVRGAAKYLKELGVNEDESLALAGYNAGPGNPSAAGSYPQDVQASAAQYAKLDRVKGVKGKPVGPPPKKSVTRFEAIVDEAKKIESAAKPYVYGGSHVAGKVPGPAKAGSYDCSSSVSRVLQSAGVKLPGALVSGDLATTPLLKDGPGAVTVYANDGHTFMRIGNRFWGTSQSNPSGGPGWVEGGYDADYLSQYTVRHVPGLDSKVARQMGIRLPAGGSVPGLSYSNGGATATITDGVTQSVPGPSDKPIKADARLAKKRKVKQQSARERSALIRSIIAKGSAPDLDPLEGFTPTQLPERQVTLEI